MLKRGRKSKSIIKAVLYVFFLSILFLLILNIIFPKASWLRKPVLINPVITNKNMDVSKISEFLKESNISFFSISAVSDYFEINLKDGGKIYLSPSKNIRIQISSLQVILKQLTINGKRFSLIDFRFDKPVVVF